MTALPNRSFHQRTFSAVTGWTRPQELTPFIIPNLERDSLHRIVLTLDLARGHSDPIVRAMVTDAQRFWGTVDDLIELVIQRRDRGAARMLERFLSFRERSELRTGFTQYGHDGAGVGDGTIGVVLRDFLLTYPGFRKTLSIHPDALELLPQFGDDRVTDIHGAVALRRIIRYTQQFNKKFDPACLRECEWKHVYNGDTGQFDATVRAVVPVDDHGRPILLLPKEIVRGSSALDSRDFLSRILVDGRWLKQSFSKIELLEEIGLDVKRFTHFVGSQLKGIRPHSGFQNGTIQRRKRRP